MPNQNGIFYEQQRGGLCRLHSINGYFGEAKITTEKFTEYSKELDKYIKEKFHEESHCMKFDSVSSDHNILVTFILKHYGVYPRYLHVNSAYGGDKLKEHLKDLHGDYFFMYNSEHIWGIRRKDNKWYRVDSLNGVRPCNVDSLGNQKNVGFLIPVVPKTEFFRNVEKIQFILKRDIPELDPANFAKTLEQLKKYLGELSDKEIILGDLEIPLGVSMDILDVVYGKVGDYKKSGPETDFKKEEFKPIEHIIKQYDEFLFNFTPSHYHDKELKLKYLPNTLMTLMKLKIKKN
jgi:hypothetical protein